MEDKNSTTKKTEESLTEKIDSTETKKEVSIGKKQESAIKKDEEEKINKKEAIVNGRSLPISKKKAVAICSFIKNKNIDKAILMLEQVMRFKKAVPMKGEIPHRRGNIMSGRYPVKTAEEFIRLLKSLKANAIANELEYEKYVIAAKADKASRPYKRFGRYKYKRAHVSIKLIKPKESSKKFNRK